MVQGCKQLQYDDQKRVGKSLKYNFRRKEQEVLVSSDKLSVYKLKIQIFLKKILIARTYSYCRAILVI